MGPELTSGQRPTIPDAGRRVSLGVRAGRRKTQCRGIQRPLGGRLKALFVALVQSVLCVRLRASHFHFSELLLETSAHTFGAPTLGQAQFQVLRVEQ